MHRNWRSLIRPKGLEIEKETLTPTYGKFEVKPLERGFGITLGNSDLVAHDAPRIVVQVHPSKPFPIAVIAASAAVSAIAVAR